MSIYYTTLGLCILTLSAVLAFPFSSVSGSGKCSAASASADGKNGLKTKKGRYYFYENGKMVKNCWRIVKGKKYYFKKDGATAVLSYKIKGKYYVFNQKGQLMQPSSTKVIKIGKKKYQVNSKGRAVKGWSRNKKNYFYNTGEMAVGIMAMKDKFYCFSSGGTYNKQKTTKLRKAAKYEKPFAPIQKIIGKPKKSEYHGGGCYKYKDKDGNSRDGEDGVLTYENFTVFTFRIYGGQEIFMGVE